MRALYVLDDNEINGLHFWTVVSKLEMKKTKIKCAESYKVRQIKIL
jgi:hypothetical protein